VERKADRGAVGGNGAVRNNCAQVSLKTLTQPIKYVRKEPDRFDLLDDLAEEDYLRCCERLE
jgi:hypothetical protein